MLVSLSISRPLLISFQQDCEYDSLSLSSKMGSGEVRKHGLFCGSRLPPVITSEGNSLRLEFNSDNSVQKSGFAAIFFTGKQNWLVLHTMTKLNINSKKSQSLILPLWSGKGGHKEIRQQMITPI